MKEVKMTKEYEEAREKVGIQLLKSLKRAMGFGEYKAEHWGLMTEQERQVYLNMANKILNLQGDGWAMAIVKVEAPFNVQNSANLNFRQVIHQAGENEKGMI